MNLRPADPDADRWALARAGDTRHPAFLRLARPYARHRVARGLDGMWVAGLDQARAALADRPVIFASNHVAWWDTLLLVVLDAALGGRCWAVMDAANLRTLPFLGWVGANLALRVIMALRYGHSPLSVLGHPVAVLHMMGVLLDSFRCSRRGDIRWRGRSYPARSQREAA